MTTLRIRSIKPALWLDEKLGVMPVGARLLFIGLIGHADDDGLLRAAPAVLRGQVFPYDEEVSTRDVSGWLQQLHEARIIDLYGPPSGQQYARISNWHKHQRISHPRKSDLPMVSPHCPIRERGNKQGFPSIRESDRGTTADDRRPDRKGIGKGEESRQPTSGRPVPVEQQPEVVACFDAYLNLFGKAGPLALELSGKRARAIDKALKKWGRERVWHSLLGHRSNDWRMEQLSRNDVTVLLRPENVETGLEWYAKSKGASTLPAVDELERAGY